MQMRESRVIYDITSNPLKSIIQIHFQSIIVSKIISNVVY